MTFHRSDDLAQSTGPWREAGEARSIIDFGFHFGVTSRAHVETLAENAARFGVTSIKVYLMYKGAAGAAKGFGEVDDALLFRALQAGAKIPGAVVGVHCENTEVIPVFREPLREAGRDDLRAWMNRAPAFWKPRTSSASAGLARKPAARSISCICLPGKPRHRAPSAPARQGTDPCRDLRALPLALA
ncbi:hypothetical protein [Gemmobacter sp. 24YEA27]|uniref:hypothetical protein n=1 Tax=Gemmobacter sp. 24YEA27 TaxID=3040672 RepID=UPI0024B364D0|nr:hypothetical protein [Gemmobacter sp. 24YEA27]